MGVPTEMSAQDGQRHLITDVFDPGRKVLLVAFSPLVVAVMAVTGIATLLVSGYLGYTGDAHGPGGILNDAWLLYAWLCLVELLVIVAVLRHPQLRAQLNAMLLVSVLAMAAVGALWATGMAAALFRVALAHALEATALVIGLVGARLVWALVRRSGFGSILLDFVGLNSVGVAVAAHFWWLYLHLQGLATAAPSISGDFQTALVIAGLAATGGTLAVVTLLFVLARLMLRISVAFNTFQFLWFIFYAAYAALPVTALVNAVTWFAGLSPRTPFFQPTVSSVWSILVFVGLGGQVVWQEARKARS